MQVLWEGEILTFKSACGGASRCRPFDMTSTERLLHIRNDLAEYCSVGLASGFNRVWLG